MEFHNPEFEQRITIHGPYPDYEYAKSVCQELITQLVDSRESYRLLPSNDKNPITFTLVDITDTPRVQFHIQQSRSTQKHGESWEIIETPLFLN